jgi:hypothetical protein
LAGSDEIDQCFDVGGIRKFLFQSLDCLGSVQLGIVKTLVGLPDGGNGFFGKVPALESDQVHCRHLGGIAVSDKKGRNILDDFGAASDERVLADAAELMYGGQTADNSIIFHNHMPGEGAVVGEDAVVPDHTIVGYMAVGEKEVV